MMIHDMPDIFSHENLSFDIKTSNGKCHGLPKDFIRQKNHNELSITQDRFSTSTKKHATIYFLFHQLNLPKICIDMATM